MRDTRDTKDDSNTPDIREISRDDKNIMYTDDIKDTKDI